MVDALLHKQPTWAIEGEAFLRACQALITRDFRICWYERFPAPKMMTIAQQRESMPLRAADGGGSTPAQTLQLSASLAMNPPDNTKITMTKTNWIKFPWGCCQNIQEKPSLRMLCLACNEPFEAPFDD